MTHSPSSLQRQEVFVLQYRFTFLRSGESPLSKKVKVYLPQITSGRVCVCVFRVCNRMQKQTVQEAGME